MASLDKKINVLIIINKPNHIDNDTDLTYGGGKNGGGRRFGLQIESETANTFV